jgi:hypothetical protein
MITSEKLRWDNLAYNILQRFAKVLKPLIDLYEKPLINKYGKNINQSGFSPVFIIGPPRTGSTILYQILTNNLDLLYIDNLMDIFHRNILFGGRLSYFLFRNKPHNCFQSKYGGTFRCGMHAPSECGRFWYQWIPNQQHFVDFDELNSKSVKEIRFLLNAIMNKLGKPIVIKNLANSLRLRLISQIFPYSKIIFIRRDPLETSLSVYRARKNKRIDPQSTWSITPPNLEKLGQMTEYELIVRQIFLIERQIWMDKKFFPSQNFYYLNYNQFINDPKTEINSLRNFIHPNISYRNNFISSEFKKKSYYNMNQQIIDAFKLEIDKLNWETYEI